MVTSVFQTIASEYSVDDFFLIFAVFKLISFQVIKHSVPNKIKVYENKFINMGAIMIWKL